MIACKRHPYTGNIKKCDLYLTEKLAIVKANSEPLLNTRDEFLNVGRHMNKITLKFFNNK